MKLMPMGEMVRAAYSKYAVPAINVSSMEHIQCVLDVAQRMRSPVIVQAAPVELRHAPAKLISAMTKALAENVDVPVAIHLDHGDGYETTVQCVQAGFNSAMFDGSRLPFERNLSESRRIKALCDAAGLSFEIELGTVGNASEVDAQSVRDYMTSPEQAAELVAAVRPDALAVAIGNAHGLYPFPPKLDFARLQAITEATGHLPLVLHGGTGIPGEAIRKAIPMGIAKINFATAMRVAFIDGMKRFMAEHPEETFTFNIFQPAMQGFREKVEEAIEFCGSEGKA